MNHPTTLLMHPRTRELLGFLDTQHAALYAAVDDIPPALRERHLTDGAWSVAEILEHLAIVERRLTGRLGQMLADAKARGVDPELDTTPVVLEHEQRMVGDRTRRLEAPDAIRPTGTLDADAALAAAKEARAGLRDMVIEADGLALGTLTAPHPVFGPLNWYQWIAFAAGHQARHTAQIRALPLE